LQRNIILLLRVIRHYQGCGLGAILDRGADSTYRKCMGKPSKPLAVRSGKKSVTVYLSVTMWRELRVLAALNDTTLDALLRRGAELVRAEYKDKRAG
jgi:antitoxin-like ribbon-helix-helix protein